MKFINLFFFGSLFLSACQLNSGKAGENTMPGTWILYDVAPLGEKASGPDNFAINAALKKSVKDGMMLSLFKDGSYTEIVGEEQYKTGKWELSAGKKILTLTRPGWRSGPIPFDLQKNQKGKMMLSLNMEGRNVSLKFIREAATTADVEDDPFHPENNKWRVRPSQPEDSAALNTRLLGYFKHLALILKAAKERKQDIISFQFSQGPVKIYNGGIGIHPYSQVPATWKKSFYNEEDAMAAYRSFEEYLRTSESYKGASSGNWVEDDYNILLLIYADMGAQTEKGQ